MNATRIFLIILCILLSRLSLSAVEAGEVRGRVIDAETEEPVIGAVVRTKGAFTSTDADGRFVIAPKAGADSISFRCLGYRTLSLPLSADLSAVRLSRKETRLRDVIVEAPDIYARGDTLVFNVERYATATDNAIIDIIKRLPGIKVEEDGTIKYQGKPISKFYLDGNDFLGGQYGLATNNISHKDVKSVEVLENHQPVKALEGIEFPEEAGINLTLKDGAKGRWMGVANASAGIPPALLSGSIYTIRMAPKVQNVFTLKADNTGWNPANEIREHEFGDVFSSGYSQSFYWQDYISADRVVSPLAEKRTRDNLSWLGSSITGWKKGDTSMRLKLNYMADRLDYTSEVRTDYLSAEIPDFVQHNALRTQQHDLSAQFNAEVNRRDLYLKDKLTVAGVWEDSRSLITGSFDLTQRVARRTFSAVNDLKLVRRNDKRLFSISSRNAFSHCPDRLAVAAEADALQTVSTTDFRSTTETQFGRFSRFWKYYLTAGLDFDAHRMASSLSGVQPFDDSATFHAIVSDLCAIPQVDYDRNGWRASLRMQMRWIHQSVRTSRDYLNLIPRVSLTRQLTAKSELSASLDFRLSSPQPSLELDVPILSDYRNLYLAVATDRYSQATSSSIAWRYRNPLRALFLNASASFNYRRDALMSSQQFVGDFIITTFARRLSSARTWTLNAGVSKGLGHSRMVVGCDFSSSLSRASSMRDGSVIPFRQLSVGVKPYFKGSLRRWLSIHYEASYDYSRLSLDSPVDDSPNGSGERAGILRSGNKSDNPGTGDRSSGYSSLRQNFYATLIPSDPISFTFGIEHYFTRFPEGNSTNLILADFATAWRISNKVRLTLTLNNLFDQRNYQYISYGTLSRSEFSFRILPSRLLLSAQVRF
ncbi:MAG: carboxypeptidase-like regulatory domain-containing protein [Muribaculaceae bacterium]|nr:carboxypeptidase-like regulatory domain-containing protein [Muribaculaceae bacterium]